MDKLGLWMTSAVVAMAAWVLGQVGGAVDIEPIGRLAASETEPLSRSFF